MDFNTILFERKKKGAIITLHRPDSMNAINKEFLREFGMLLEEIENDCEIRALIITGGDKIFSVGADIREVSSIQTPAEAYRYVDQAQKLFNKIEGIGKPVIAAIGGLAFGGGCEMVLACDIRIASENASFALPEIKLGALPGGGGTQRLPRLIGTGRAKELLLFGDPIDAKEAYRIGLVNKVVPAGSLLAEAKQMAFKLSKQPIFALKMIKKTVDEGINMDLQSALSYEALSFAMLFSVQEIKEGMAAFIEKRKAEFSDK